MHVGVQNVFPTALLFHVAILNQKNWHLLGYLWEKSVPQLPWNACNKDRWVWIETRLGSDGFCFLCVFSNLRWWIEHGCRAKIQKKKRKHSTKIWSNSYSVACCSLNITEHNWHCQLPTKAPPLTLCNQSSFQPLEMINSFLLWGRIICRAIEARCCTRQPFVHRWPRNSIQYERMRPKGSGRAGRSHRFL